LPKKILISLNTAWNLLNFRAGLIGGLISSGYEVVALAPKDGYVVKLELLGCRFVHLEMDNQGTRPIGDLLLLWRFFRMLKTEKPDLCLFYTVKPNVYGSLASAICGVPFINNVSGLGAVFIQGGWLKRFVSALYRIAFKNSNRIFFQNKDDLGLFLENRLVKEELTDLLPGSGINLKHFTPIVDTDRKKLTSPFRFLLIARMLKDKGVVEFVNAAKLLKESGVMAEFCLLGFLDVQNPAAISSEQMKEWTTQGHVKFLGTSDDVREHISSADCIVLPSYREGTPRSLLEAAAMAKPIITTNVVGCKEVVEHGVNGFLCEVKNARDLAVKMKEMLLLSEDQRRLMGVNSRLKMEKEFDENIVTQKYLQAIDLAMRGCPNFCVNGVKGH
jgi:glycosyltransferase involved in cell wall biosynthesis